jgi:hypothetical protein
MSGGGSDAAGTQTTHGTKCVYITAYPLFNNINILNAVNLSSEEAQVRIDTNDQPNALSILENLLPVTRKIISVPLSGAQ